MSLQVFKSACEDGLVNELSWNEIRRCLPPRLLMDELGLTLAKPPGAIEVSDLPKTWRRKLLVSKSERKQRRHKRQDAERRREQEIERRRSAPERRFRSISEGSWDSGRDL